MAIRIATTEDHTIEDFAFKYVSGWYGPILMPSIENDEIYLHIPARVWCKRHGWEAIDPNRD